jgi:hypothetical protein
VVLLRLGGLPVVVVSSAEAAREVMVSHDIDFATRPITRTVRLAIPEGAPGIIFVPYGDEWRQIRKICTVELLSARRVCSLVLSSTSRSWIRRIQRRRKKTPVFVLRKSICSFSVLLFYLFSIQITETGGEIGVDPIQTCHPTSNGDRSSLNVHYPKD